MPTKVKKKLKNLSEKKRLRQNKTACLRNRVIKSRFKTAAKKFLISINTHQSLEEVLQKLKRVYATLDKGLKKSVFHKNYVARNKGKWSKKYNQFKKNLETKTENLTQDTTT